MVQSIAMVGGPRLVNLADQWTITSLQRSSTYARSNMDGCRLLLQEANMVELLKSDCKKKAKQATICLQPGQPTHSQPETIRPVVLMRARALLTRVSNLLQLLFLVSVTPIMHDFYNQDVGSTEQTIELIQFMKVGHPQHQWPLQAWIPCYDALSL